MENEFHMKKIENYISLHTYTGESVRVHIPSTTPLGDLQVIGASVFENCQTIKEVLIPDGVEQISKCAFLGCTNLERVIIPDSVHFIGASAFKNCVNLKQIDLPSELERLGESVLSGCSSLENIRIPSGTSTVPAFGFHECTSLRDVDLPDTTRSIFTEAFSGCESLKSINFPPSLAAISRKAFQNCKSLVEIEFQKECPDVKENLSKKEIPFVKQYTSVKEEAFKGCSQLEKVVVSEDEVVFYGNCFADCDLLYQYDFRFISYLPLEEQPYYVFRLIENREKVEIKVIKELISYTKRKRSLKIPLFTSDGHSEISFLLEHNFKFSLEELELILGQTVEKNRTQITAIFLDYKNKHFSTEHMKSFQDRKELLEMGFEYPTKSEFKTKWRCSSVEGGLQVSGYKGDLEEEILPACLEDGTKIVKLAFSKDGFASLKKLTVEAEIKMIAGKTFQFCRNLEEIVLPDSLVEIGEHAFAHCNNLLEIRIPDNVTKIKKSTFAHCDRLKKVYGCENLESVDEYAFFRCVALQEVCFTKSLRKIEIMSFALARDLDELKLPEALYMSNPTFFSSLTKKVVVVNAKNEVVVVE